ncbi:CBS domain-containing protein [Aureibacter tunicatorum]|uniref:CBS domain-containing protein n=1 Tax=Aureibacter tunicatorum TaxID=866807 RepID=A0AAE3XK18_9BACT|nr:CBS domain-containing protein [Aureibacter tunicatorum]MDR6238068.1 CBS domain-containing protein [Aureibacter tunicatorum]BDD03101.1 hypothetical protein AUTU_05840 [Aureibacter tunicatorum]
MIAEELINYSIPPLKPNDHTQSAILWMEEMRVNQLPVIDGRNFVGFLSEDTILESNVISDEIHHYRLSGEGCRVKGDQHVYEVIRKTTEFDLPLVAVLDDEEQYQGVVTLEDAVRSLTGSSAFKATGGVIILSLKKIDYSLAEISRLVESNEAKILSLYTKDDDIDPHMMTVTMKLNISDLRHVIATLERFEYQIIAKFDERKHVSADKERLGLFLKYLDI